MAETRPAALVEAVAEAALAEEVFDLAAVAEAAAAEVTILLTEEEAAAEDDGMLMVTEALREVLAVTDPVVPWPVM